MSASVTHRLTTAEAAKHAASQLGLDDVKRVGIALAVAAAEELDYNTVFAARVRMAYSRLAAAPGTKARPRTSKALEVTLVPVKHVEGFDLNPATPLDPYLVYEAFGANQLPIALNLFPLAKLKEASALVEQRCPGTKPANRSKKDAVIAYIVEQVAGRRSM
jgi:hypothetical protein